MATKRVVTTNTVPALGTKTQEEFDAQLNKDITEHNTLLLPDLLNGYRVLSDTCCTLEDDGTYSIVTVLTNNPGEGFSPVLRG